MADHLSDDQQLEALKNWWRRNGFSLLLILVLGGGGWFGWSYWQKQQAQTATESSLLYMAMLDALSQWRAEPSRELADKVASHGESLKKLDEDSISARLAALAIATLAANDRDYDEAAAELRWALARAEDEADRSLITYRLASVEYARGNLDDALALLDEPHSPPFEALFAELRGDVHAAAGDRERARVAYETALARSGPSRSRALLELKLNDVAPPADDTTDAEEEDDA